MDVSRLFRVDGMIAVVTGGATGFMMAKALATAGARKVYILGRRKSALEKAAAQNERLIPLECDVTEKESLQSAVDTITKDTGYVNLVVANSGVLGPRNNFDPSFSIQELRKHMFEDVSVEDFTGVYKVNVTGAWFTLMAFLELLDAGNKNALKGGFGAPLKEGGNVPSIQSQVIITSSVGCFSRDRFSVPGYSGSKAAVSHLTKHASTNLAPYEVRVNAMAPGYFESEMAHDYIAVRDPTTESPEHSQYIPARRFGEEEEMSGSLLYLASRAGSYCNGLILLNDGGRSAVTTATY